MSYTTGKQFANWKSMEIIIELLVRWIGIEMWLFVTIVSQKFMAITGESIKFMANNIIFIDSNMSFL